MIVGIVKENYGFPKMCPKYHLKTQKTVHKCIGATLPRLKIDSKSLKTRLEWGYQILKFLKQQLFRLPA